MVMGKQGNGVTFQWVAVTVITVMLGAGCVLAKMYLGTEAAHEVRQDESIMTLKEDMSAIQQLFTSQREWNQRIEDKIDRLLEK